MEKGILGGVLADPIASHRSVRSFLDCPLDRSAVRRILEAGAKAPSAKNRQPWRFVYIDDRDKIARIQEAAFGQPHVGEAPGIVALCTTNVDYRMPNGQLSYPIDLSFAASFMMIQAHSEGLGTCVVTTFDEADIKDIISVPYSMRVVLLLLVGTPGEEKTPAERRPAESVIALNHW